MTQTLNMTEWSVPDVASVRNLADIFQYTVRINISINYLYIAPRQCITIITQGSGIHKKIGHGKWKKKQTNKLITQTNKQVLNYKKEMVIHI